MRAELAVLVSLASACTSVSADVRRSDIVVHVERVRALPSGWRVDAGDRITGITVVTAEGATRHEATCARVDGAELVLAGADQELGSAEIWRGPVDAVTALELRRAYVSEARLRAEADDAGPTALAVTGLGLATLVMFLIALEGIN